MKLYLKADHLYGNDLRAMIRDHFLRASLICLILPVSLAAFGQRGALGTYQFPDSTYVSLGFMDDRQVAIFGDGQVRGIRNGNHSKQYEIGSSVGRFDVIEGFINQVNAQIIELVRPGQPPQRGQLLPARMKNISFTNGDVKLKGTLILPEGKGPFPCIVFTHGSGPEHKEASYGLAFLFAHHGFAALTFDKRFANDENGKRFEDSFENYALDAIAGAKYAAGLPEINKSQIGIYGHSQGGWVAPLAATTSDIFSFLIISAGNVVSPVEQHLYNGSCALRQGGVPEQAIQEIFDFRWIKYEAGITGSREKYDKALPIAQQKPWFERTGGELPQSKFWKLNGFYDARPTLLKVKIPVLIISGEHDRYTDTKTNMMLFKEIFEQNGNKDVTYRVFPSANHAFMLTPTGKLDGTELPDLKQFVDGYFDQLLSWVKQRTR